MSEFCEQFLMEDARRLGSGSGCFVQLAAFGKHPGWDDHMEDIGLASRSLVLARSHLYARGINTNLDKNTWRSLEPGQRTEGFDHAFLWLRNQQSLLGRLWSSKDGKGRHDYPMAACLHVTEVSLGKLLDKSWGLLEEVRDGCQKKTTAGEIRHLFEKYQKATQAVLDGAPYSALRPKPELLDHHDLGPKREGIYRIMYRLESQASGYAPGAFKPNRGTTVLRPQQIRVPACSIKPVDSLMFWTWVFRAFVDLQAPLLLMARLDQGWVDVTVGEPTPEEFFSLQASTKRLPLTNEIPYKLDAAFRDHAEQFLQKLVQRPVGDFGNPIVEEESTAFVRLSKAFKDLFG